jgi:hypothetical protein
MSRASAADWDRYYETSSRRRRAAGGDPLVAFRDRQLARERALLVAGAVILGGLIAAFCSILTS